MTEDNQGPLGFKTKQQLIADYYAGLIDIGQISEGAQLPGRAEIADTFGVGRSIAQQALEILRDTGWTVTIQGHGSYAVRKRQVSPGRC